MDPLAPPHVLAFGSGRKCIGFLKTDFYTMHFYTVFLTIFFCHFSDVKEQ